MYEINGNLVNIDKYKVFSFAVAVVVGEFNSMFGEEIMTKYPLYIDNCFDNGFSKCGYTPIITPVLKQILIIKLGLDDFGNFANAVYQLSHELCHYVFYSIEGITRANIGDQEERVCSAMSLILIKKLCDNPTFELYCEHVKGLTDEQYREGYKVAYELEFDQGKIVNRILNRN